MTVQQLEQSLKQQYRRFPNALYHISLTAGHDYNQNLGKIVSCQERHSKGFLGKLSGDFVSLAFGVLPESGRVIVVSYDIINRLYRIKDN